tara:strand:- start:27409 stop:28476 length:1068 start_codon:yes stop_codon:yes gene_type:complete
MEYSKNNNIIDLYKIYLKLWKNRKIILYTIALFGIIGIIYSLSLNIVFVSSTTFYPRYEKGNQSNSIADIAGLAGIDIGKNLSNDIPSNLYPNLLSSTPFKQKVLNKKININNKKITYREYLLTEKKKNKSFLSDLIKSFYKTESNDKIQNQNPNSKIIELDNIEYQLHISVQDLIKIDVNKKDGYITLMVYDENPLVSSQIAQITRDLLQEYIIDYKLKNIKLVYNFTVNQLQNTKKNLYNLQDSLALFRDSNKNIKSDLFKNKQSRLETEYNLVKNIYNELAISKEKTAIEVKRNTPIFTIINPVVIPNERYSPKRKIIVISFCFIGLILITSLIILKNYYKENLIYFDKFIK